MIGGTCIPGELQQLQDDNEDFEKYIDRFALLNGVLEKIASDSIVTLLKKDIVRLPEVERHTKHLMDDYSPRCCLLAEFALKDGNHRFVADIDVSDGESLSTKIVTFSDSFYGRSAISRILRGVVQKSLKWPNAIIKTTCLSSNKVNHPSNLNGENAERKIESWIQRLTKAITGC